MALTSFQKKLLKSYQVFQLGPPKFGQLIRLNLKALGVFFMIAVTGLYVAWTSLGVMSGLGLFAAGMSFGAMIRLMGQILLSVRVWPTLHAIIDWQKIGPLLLEEKNP